MTEMDNRIRTLMTLDVWTSDTKATEDSLFILSSPLATPPFKPSRLSCTSSAAPIMPTLRIPDILGAMDGFELRTHPEERQVTRETNEWFARFVSPFSFCLRLCI